MSYYLFPKGNLPTKRSSNPDKGSNKNTLMTKGNIVPKQNTSFFIQLREHLSLQNYLSPSLVSYLYEIQENIIDYPAVQALQKEIFTYNKGILEKYHQYSPAFFEIIEIVQTMHLNQYLDMVSKTVGTLSIFSFDSNEEHKKGVLTAIKTIREPYKRIAENNGISAVPYKDNYFITESSLEYSLEKCKEMYFNYGSKMHVILADSTKCVNIPEIAIQMCMILTIQARKGMLIWKIGETYSPVMLDMLYILSSFYDKMYFIKPNIMDTSSSDKYVVCKGFTFGNHNPSTSISSIYSYVHSLVSQMTILRMTPNISIYRILQKEIPFFFVNKLEEIHYLLGQVQLEQLHYLSILIHHKYKYDKIQNIAKINVQKTQEWLAKHHYFLQSIF